MDKFYKSQRGQFFAGVVMMTKVGAVVAPDFTLTDVQGQNVTLSDYRRTNLYGQEVNLLKFGRLPALILIDKRGQIRYKHYGTSMRDIVDDAEILTLLDRLKQEKDE